MSGVKLIAVEADEAGVRTDRWFKRRYPALGHGALEKLLRKGQIRVDGKRVKSSHRLIAGSVVRVPPMGDKSGETSGANTAPKSELNPRDTALLTENVLYQDDWVIAINKPAGLAVQGGTGTKVHVDGLLDSLRFGSKDRPRLVHRLDKDTSGVLLIARLARRPES